MEGDDVPAGKAGKLGFSVFCQILQVCQQSGQILCESAREAWIPGGQTVADVLSHGRSMDGGEPDMGVVIVVMPMVIMIVVVIFVRAEQFNAVGSIDDVVGAVEGVLQESLQTGAGDDDSVCAFNGPHLTDLQRVVVEARYAFCYQTGDRDAGAFAEPGSKFVDRQRGGGNLGRFRGYGAAV